MDEIYITLSMFKLPNSIPDYMYHNSQLDSLILKYGDTCKMSILINDDIFKAVNQKLQIKI